LLLLAPPRWLLRVFECAPLVGLGRISYALYLFHMPILQWLHPRGAGSVALALGLSVVAAVLSYAFIERPFTRANPRHASGAPAGQAGATIATSRRVACTRLGGAASTYRFARLNIQVWTPGGRA
jgi:peptidoglycan/LPS O-acetylase OafA/YrhL